MLRPSEAIRVYRRRIKEFVRNENGNTKIYTGMSKLPIKKVSPCKNSTTHGPYGHSSGTAFDKVSIDIVGPLPIRIQIHTHDSRSAD